jgi:hypothetical protein
MEIIIIIIFFILGIILINYIHGKKYKVSQTLIFNNTIKIKGELKMTQFQIDQSAIWKLQFLNDNDVAVEVASFEAVSSVEGLTVEILAVDTDTWTYSVKISATEVVAGSIDAKGVTASGVELPVQLAVSTIPDEAESVTSVVEIVEND